MGGKLWAQAPCPGLGAADTKGRPGPGAAVSELQYALEGCHLPSASTPWEEPAVCRQSSRIELARPLLFPHPHRPRRVHQGLALILILFKRHKSDSTVSLEAIYTPPLAMAPSPPVHRPIRSINRKFLQGKLDCCTIRETGRQSISIQACGLAGWL